MTHLVSSASSIIHAHAAEPPALTSCPGTSTGTQVTEFYMYKLLLIKFPNCPQSKL